MPDLLFIHKGTGSNFKRHYLHFFDKRFPRQAQVHRLVSVFELFRKYLFLQNTVLKVLSKEYTAAFYATVFTTVHINDMDPIQFTNYSITDAIPPTLYNQGCFHFCSQNKICIVSFNITS